MTTTITIYGASDDLVEVEGCEGSGRVQHRPLAGRPRAAGVGQVIEDHPLPPWPISITQAPAMSPGNPGYSALLTIEAPDGTRLVNVRPAPGDGH